MIELEFNQKIKKYSNLSEKVKRLNKIKDKLNLEIKEEIIKRTNGKIEIGKKVKITIQGYRAILKKRERIYANKKKINKFLKENKKKISEYYTKTEYFTLYIERNKKELKEMKI